MYGNLKCCVTPHGEIRKHFLTGRMVKAPKGSGGVTAPESVQKMSRMWHFVIWYRGCHGVWSEVGPDDLGRLFQP